ncbi:MAG: methyltransferase domain-containing protein [Burkholderiales bacterium]|nr:methyltransferase domain-containing protein [Burkholderiales bacterium]
MGTPALSDWFATTLGQYVLRGEQTYFDKEVADVFGFNAFQIGLPEHDFLRANRMPFRCVTARDGNVSFAADARALPIGTGVADLIILPHALEFSENPHQVLREVQRVLMPEGHVMLSGFNPWSLWGVRRIGALSSDFPWRGQFVSLARIRDWLALLGFEVATGRMGCYVPPIASDKWRGRFEFMDKAGDRWWPFAGGVYFLHGIKRVQGMRIITPKWRGGRSRERLAVLPQRRTRTEDTLAVRNGDD